MGNQSDVVMSGVVDSGRERGHGNIDANEPERTSQRVFGASHSQPQGRYQPDTRSNQRGR